MLKQAPPLVTMHAADGTEAVTLKYKSVLIGAGVLGEIRMSGPDKDVPFWVHVNMVPAATLIPSGLFAPEY